MAPPAGSPCSRGKLRAASPEGPAPEGAALNIAWEPYGLKFPARLLLQPSKGVRGPVVQTGEARSSSTLVRGHWVGACTFFFLLLPHRIFSHPLLSVPRCPEGKVITSNCSSQNDLQCVDQESSTQASGKVPVPREQVTTSPGPPTAPSPSSGDLALKIGVPVGSLCLLMLVSCACYHRRRILQGEVCGRWGGAGTLCHLPHFLLCFSDRKSLLSTWQIPLFSSDLALTPFPVIPPPCPTSPLQGWDHISVLVSRLTVTSSSWPSLGGQDQFFRVPSQSREVVSPCIW